MGALHAMCRDVGTLIYDMVSEEELVVKREWRWVNPTNAADLVQMGGWMYAWGFVKWKNWDVEGGVAVWDVVWCG